MENFISESYMSSNVEIAKFKIQIILVFKAQILKYIHERQSRVAMSRDYTFSSGGISWPERRRENFGLLVSLMQGMTLSFCTFTLS
jgi:hypothetical protein